jgi:hypothetical protein
MMQAEINYTMYLRKQRSLHTVKYNMSRKSESATIKSMQTSLRERRNVDRIQRRVKCYLYSPNAVLEPE